MRLNKKQVSLASAFRTDQAAPPCDPGQDTVLASRLMPEVFEGYEPGDRLTVLDLGSGSAGTVNYLSQFQAKISFVDLLEHLDELQNPELSPAQALSTCSRLMGLKPNTKYDIILLWDVVHYLPVSMLEALSSILELHTHKHSRGYGFGSLQGDRIHEPYHYGIQSLDKIQVKPSTRTVYTAHSQQQMNQKFLCMHIAKATLLQEGKLELLFERH